MQSKWNHKAPFNKQNNAKLIKVWRIISTDPNGIFSVQWLHLYQKNDLNLYTVESYARSTYVKGEVIEDESRNFYTEDELCEIESDWSFIDDTLVAAEFGREDFKDISDVEIYVDNWIYENCKCDGGYSRHGVKEANRNALSDSD